MNEMIFSRKRSFAQLASKSSRSAKSPTACVCAVEFKTICSGLFNWLAHMQNDKDSQLESQLMYLQGSIPRGTVSTYDSIATSITSSALMTWNEYGFHVSMASVYSALCNSETGQRNCAEISTRKEISTYVYHSAAYLIKVLVWMQQVWWVYVIGKQVFEPLTMPQWQSTFVHRCPLALLLHLQQLTTMVQSAWTFKPIWQIPRPNQIYISKTFARPVYIFPVNLAW